MNDNCFYCSKSEDLLRLMKKVCILKNSTVYLFKDQNHRGGVVAYKDHVTEIFHLSRLDMHLWMNEVSLVAKAVSNVVGADKINYGIFGDIVSHLHVHIVPKFQGGPFWGEFINFEKIPKLILKDEDFENLLVSIREEIEMLCILEG